MNKNLIKSYAPQARRDFIQAVTDRAGKLGLTNDHIEPVKIQGDVATIGGQAFPRKVGELRQELERRIKRKGFDQFIEAMAYTWFNRFVALRYMEIHDYLAHGWRVLSNRSGPDIPEILENAAELELPGLDQGQVIEFKLAGDRDNELYRMLLIAQCNALHSSMPFLFERLDDATELMLPDNLLHTDSPLQKLVQALPEEEWQDVEVIGWIYQFYMSEKKDQVIGKTVQPEDIPAATSLFTPNWIVRYMVHNTLGRMWLATYPESSIRDKMEFYIEPAEQEPEVQAELDRITPKELYPEQITFLDPACGSGHILVEAYNLFKEIYLEQGYRTRDIPYYILQNNLFGLEIDDRSAQLAGFALLMKARQDNRRILEKNNLQLNVQSFQETNGLDADYLARTLLRTRGRRLGPQQQQGYLVAPKEKQLYEEKEQPEIGKAQLQDLLNLFRDAKTFGSLLQVTEGIWNNLPALERLIEQSKQGDIEQLKAAELLEPLVRQARMLGEKYDCVVANPPYMVRRYQEPKLKEYLKAYFKGYESDLFSAFIVRNMWFADEHGRLGFMCPFVWMFISSYEELRLKCINEAQISSLVQLEYSGFDGATVPICTFVLGKKHISNWLGCFIRLTDFRGSENQAPKTLEAIQNRDCGWFYTSRPDDFKKIPGSPISYWINIKIANIFEYSFPLKKIGDTRQGMATSDNERFVRAWHEVNIEKSCLNAINRVEAQKSRKKWFPYNKGGDFRKWYGNSDFFVNWENDGEEILKHAASLYGSPTRTIKSISKYFKPCISWSKISSANLAMRYYPSGYIFDVAGCCIFSDSINALYSLIGFCNTVLARMLLEIISPTLNFEAGQVAVLPLLDFDKFDTVTNPTKLIDMAKKDWDSYENSWDFKAAPLVIFTVNGQKSLLSSYFALHSHWHQTTQEMKRLEEENNRIFIEAYGLQDELTPEVPLEEITLTCNPYYRYGGDKPEEELEALLRTDTMKELISYAIGCMMGRYSLDEPGLIYAHEGNIGFDPPRYQNFPADDDGIVPIMDDDWFADDAANRLEEFIATAWPREYLEENLKFIANSLSPKRNESPRETIRRYLSSSFFKDHMRMYKKRPIYWLFSSGKNKAFECLVYLHRYTEATLSRMRSEYVTPLMGKLSSRIEYLQNEIDAASTASAKNKLTKELNTLKKKQAELDKFDEELRHYADQRITIDLDDGVKHNYGKFGNLLAEVKSITGKK